MALDCRTGYVPGLFSANFRFKLFNMTHIKHISMSNLDDDKQI